MAIGTTNFPTSLDTADELVRATNSASTKLTSAINSFDQTILVTSVALFPSSGIIRINDEIISYTGTSGGNTFTGCSRGFEGTTATSHQNNDNVTLDITAASNNVKNDAIIAIETKIGTGASMPTANTVMRGTGTGTSAYGQIVNGDVSASAAISYSKLESVSSTDKILGRASAGSGPIEEITCTAAGRALIDDATAADQRTTLGLGTIATQSASNVNITGGAVTGITDLTVSDGGTGLSTLTANNLLVGNASNPITFIAPGTSGNVLTSNGTIWTSAAPSSNPSGGASVSPSSTRNVLINGGFSVNQRALPDAITTTTANDTYTLDRWYALTSAGNITVSQQSLQATAIRNNLRMNQSLGSSQFMGIAQIVEGINCYWMRGLAVTLSFKVRSPEAARVIRYAVLEWSGSEDIVTSSFVTSWGSTPSWVSGISVASNNIGSASVAAGSTFQSFNLTTVLSSSFNNIIVFIWTDSAVSSTHSVDIAEVQLELGSTATVFENERIGSVLERCKRYYYMIARGSTERVIGLGTYYNPNLLVTAINLPVTMRIHPTLELNNSGLGWFMSYSAGIDDVFTGFFQAGSPGQPANTLWVQSTAANHSVGGTSGASALVVTWSASATFALSAEL